MKSERVPLSEAAEILGVNRQCLRDLMRDKKIDLGIVITGKPNKYGARRRTYIIFRRKLLKVLGREDE